MKAFFVTLSCESVNVVMEGKPQQFGFFKNEYVWETGPDLAVEKARKKVLERLSKLGVNISTNAPALQLEEVRRVSIFKPLFPQGDFFCFPPNAQE